MGASYTIGKIFYKMRMRKPIDEALRWYEQKKTLRAQRDPTIIMSQDIHSYVNQNKKSKVVSITVLKCLDLKRSDLTY